MNAITERKNWKSKVPNFIKKVNSLRRFQAPSEPSDSKVAAAAKLTSLHFEYFELSQTTWEVGVVGWVTFSPLASEIWGVAGPRQTLHLEAHERSCWLVLRTCFYGILHLKSGSNCLTCVILRLVTHHSFFKLLHLWFGWNSHRTSLMGIQIFYFVEIENVYFSQIESSTSSYIILL